MRFVLDFSAVLPRALRELQGSASKRERSRRGTR